MVQSHFRRFSRSLRIGLRPDLALGRPLRYFEALKQRFRGQTKSFNRGHSAGAHGENYGLASLTVYLRLTNVPQDVVTGRINI
jgi:hypothetical protein